MAGDPQLATYELRDATARIGLNRPGKRNAISAALLAEIEAATRRAEAEARAMVLFGHAPCFSAGLDLAEHRTRSAEAAVAERSGLLRDGIWQTIRTIRQADIATIVASRRAAAPPRPSPIPGAA